MQITNEILHCFIHCPYKAYRKSKSENGEISDFEKLSDELSNSQKIVFTEKLFTEEKLIKTQSVENNFTFTDGIIIDQKFSNSKIDLILDGIEFIGKRKAIPILLTPFEKITQTDKLFLSLQASFIQSEFNLNVENCKVIHGNNLQKTQFKLSSFTKNIKKISADLNEILTGTAEPSLVLNKHCSICEYSAFCKEKAKADGNMSLLDRATSKAIVKYRKKGIFTIQQLSYLYKPRRQKKRAKKLVAHNIELQALAIRTDKIYAQQLPELSRQPIEFFLDIEGNPDQESYYLIGILTCKDNEPRSNSLWADKASDEPHIWQQFLSIINESPHAPIYHYGNYELKAIDILGKRYNTNVTQVQNRLVNIVNSIYGKIYFPVYSNGLKDLGKYIGATWSSPNSSGIQSLVWRHRWTEKQDEIFKQILITYNLEDCQVLKLLTDKLSMIQLSSDILPEIDFGTNPKKNSSETSTLVHKQFDTILKFAHENYDGRKISIQNVSQQKILVKKKGGQIGHKGFFRTAHKTNNIIILPMKKLCPIDHYKLIKTTKSTEHLITDIAFTKHSIRKKSIKYFGSISYCSTCHKYFSPSKMTKIRSSHFGHNFKSWVIYQRLFLRLPYNIIQINFKELFNENICQGTLTNILRDFSSFYSYTEKYNLRQILNSPFIHVDETQINFKGTNNYVWIFTNGNQVLFRHTETREISMVVEFLKEFKGILISDFYPGYDSLECQHQKCWVHLIRDLNDDLWKHPFDIEYEKFITELRNLILPIFVSVEKYGSRKCHLNKFQKSIYAFYNHVLIREDYNSEITLKYQTRLKKHWKHLFTFLEFDNIPWNNNMAERGIRHLAVQRKISTFFDKGVEQYLLFLGIMQTCRFQKKSFLKFLLSGKKSL
ncbi:MAG: TM0106 family RecB-like putative nuclease [Bacteroidota bacterium]|nr:TM0106 family RecB-like putative nuclease [Bacteroidota bacterium]